MRDGILSQYTISSFIFGAAHVSKNYLRASHSGDVEQKDHVLLWRWRR